MTRVKRGTTTNARHKKIIKLAKGYRGRNKNVFTVAKQKVEKALLYAYRDRRNNRRDFRALWIQRINAYVRPMGLTYSQFIHGLKLANVDLDRKILSQLAFDDDDSMKQIVQISKDAIDNKNSKN
ncbi:MAG: 50S ribosomal protein L20 [Alphaproteobacteria bacterium]|nr:50S ribosomal protein L20 [Alphaproteobacteria bacterium]MBL0718025.1 50S ribosomal protein L20 [Alphaproteobacteria bacterium]